MMMCWLDPQCGWEGVEEGRRGRRLGWYGCGRGYVRREVVLIRVVSII